MSVRPITDTLRLLQGGTFLDQCSDTLAQVVKGVEDTGSFTPLYAQPTEPEFTASMVEAIYAAWHGAGVDITGGNWARFVGMLPRA